jgi:acetyl esterase
MASATEWALSRLRGASGTRAERARDGLVRVAGRLMDLKYERAGRHGLHPLAKVTADHVGDPLEHWDVSDLDRFRQQFDELLAYLPHDVSSRVEDSVSQVGGEELRLRTFTPAEELRDVLVVYLHGGGFVLGDEKSNDPECDALAVGLGCPVVSLGYPLSPEHPYPAPPKAVLGQLERFASESDASLALCGESAGANLALVAWQASPILRERVKALVFAYPMLDLTLSSEAVRKYRSGYFLTRDLLEWFVRCYAPDVRPTDQEISPLFGDNSQLPPTLVLAAEFDPLCGDAEAIAAVAPNAELSVYPGMLHGFLGLRGITQFRTQALEQIVRFLRSVIDADPGPASLAA